jgi:hypothetical protein
MRKLFAAILVIISVFSFAACGSYKVEGEKNAINVYTCSDKNMLGLEKIVVFEDHIVAVFDRKAPKTAGYEIDFDKIMVAKSINASANVTNASYQGSSKYDATAEIFIVTIYVSGPDGDTKVISPVQGRDVSYITIEDYTVTINGGNLRISRTDVTAEGSVLHYQDFNQVSKSWSKVNQQAA